MSFLQDWCFYNSGNEAPERFWRWAGLSLVSHIAGRKYIYQHGSFPIVPCLYTGLIGDAGSGKSTAKSEVKSVIVEHFPSLLYSASIQSREDIAKRMATPEAEIPWKKPDGTLDSYRSFYIIANEFENFLSVDPRNMVAFLTDIFDERWFSTGFKNAESQSFANPYVSILACGTPEWLMTELKLSLFKGGLGRRLILVVDESTTAFPDPERPSGWEPAKSRCIEHLKKVERLSGMFQRSALGKKWWHEWYHRHKKERPSDPILSQFHSTKHVMVLKVAQALTLAENPEHLVLTDETLQVALAFFDDLIPTIQRLTAGVGRNELAGVGTMLLDFIERLGGVVDWVHVRVHFRRFLETREFFDILADYQSTRQLKMVEIADPTTGITKKFIGTWEKMQEFEAAVAAKKRLGSLSSPPPGLSSTPGSSGPAA